MKVSGRYKGKRGEQYVSRKQSAGPHLGHRIDLDYFLPYIEHRHTVLDFGCGTGGMLSLLTGFVAEAEGLEVNPTAMRMARESGLKVYSHLADIPNDKQYDVVVSNHVLEHIRDVCTNLELVRQHLKPRGLFITKLPLDDFRSKIQRNWSTDDIDFHLHTWTPRNFANTLIESGFRVAECRIITSAWHPKLFPLARFGLGAPAFWAFALVKRRRQLFAVAVNETSTPSI